MIDIRAARAEPDAYREALARKGAVEDFDALMEADSEWLALVPRADELRAKTKVKGKPTPEQIEELKGVKAELQEVEEALATAERRRAELLDRVPSPPDPTAPDGFTDDDAEELRRVGEPPSFSFEPRDHLELGRIDTERGAKVSGSRFVYRIGAVALLELALYRFALDRLNAAGFTPVLPPVLVREDAMYGTGFLPTDEVNLYRVERDELYLTGTSEVTLAAMHGGEILEADASAPLRGLLDVLPPRGRRRRARTRAACSASTSSTRSRCSSSAAPRTRRRSTTACSRRRRSSSRELGLPYRVVNIAAGDLGASAAKKYDIEGWFPSQGRYRELTSTSNTTDYQSRRLDIRFRTEAGLEFVHTLNGTAVTARAMLAVLENFQDEGGSVSVPEALVAFGAPARIERRGLTGATLAPRAGCPSGRKGRS